MAILHILPCTSQMMVESMFTESGTLMSSFLTDTETLFCKQALLVEYTFTFS